MIKIHWISRIGLALLFIYHGLVPKILWLSTTETKLIELHHFSFAIENLSMYVGIAEILLAVAILFIRKSNIPAQLAAVVLTALLIDVAVLMPELLTDMFNPVSTNVMGLILCYVIVVTQREISRNRSYR